MGETYPLLRQGVWLYLVTLVKGDPSRKKRGPVELSSSLREGVPSGLGDRQYAPLWPPAKSLIDVRHCLIGGTTESILRVSSAYASLSGSLETDACINEHGSSSSDSADAVAFQEQVAAGTCATST